MTEHLAYGLVLIGQFMDPVIIDVEPQAQRAQHQDLPLLHAGTPGVRIGLAMDALGDDLRQNGEHPLAHLRRGVDVLQAPQQLRDIVPRFGVESDGGDVLLAELQLGVDDLAHGVSNDEV